MILLPKGSAVLGRKMWGTCIVLPNVGKKKRKKISCNKSTVCSGTLLAWSRTCGLTGTSHIPLAVTIWKSHSNLAKVEKCEQHKRGEGGKGERWGSGVEGWKSDEMLERSEVWLGNSCKWSPLPASLRLAWLLLPQLLCGISCGTCNLNSPPCPALCLTDRNNVPVGDTMLSWSSAVLFPYQHNEGICHATANSQLWSGFKLKPVCVKWLQW